MSYFHHRNRVQKVGKLDVKPTSHWNNIGREYWESCGLDLRPSQSGYTYYWQYRRDKRLTLWAVQEAMVSIQHALHKASTSGGDQVDLVGELTWWTGGPLKEHFRCPYHEDLLPNWGK